MVLKWVDAGRALHTYMLTFEDGSSEWPARSVGNRQWCPKLSTCVAFWWLEGAALCIPTALRLPASLCPALLRGA